MKTDNVEFFQELEEQKNLAGNTTTLFFCFAPSGIKIEVRV